MYMNSLTLTTPSYTYDCNLVTFSLKLDENLSKIGFIDQDLAQSYRPLKSVSLKVFEIT